MPDPYNFFNNNIHNYYKKCISKYLKETNKETNKEINNNIYYITPLNNKFNFENIIIKLSEIVSEIFNYSQNYVNKNEILYNNNIVKPKSYNNNDILSLNITQINDNLKNEAENVISNIKSILEEKYNSYLELSSYYIFRTLEQNEKLIELLNSNYSELEKITNNKANWLWHCDNTSPICFKVFIYLNDVDSNNAPFEILYNKKKNSIVKMIPYGTNLWSWKLIEVNINSNDEIPYFLQNSSLIEKCNINPNTRIPIKTINELEKKGYEKFKITGKRGTTFCFQHLMVHKANFGFKNYRDVLLLEFFPSLNKTKINLDLIRSTNEIIKNLSWNA